MLEKIIQLIAIAGRLFIPLAFFVMSVFQFFAIIDGFQIWLGLNWILAFLLALIFAGVPMIGTILGMYGAVSAWGWTWGSAFLLFFLPFILIFSVAGIMTFIEKLIQNLLSLY